MAYDAILIPGGGVRTGGELPSWVRRRLDRAIEVERGEFIITLSAGTTYRPPPADEAGFPIFESVAAARYLMAAGIAASRILTETCSYDTIGNAFFSRVIHAEPREFERLLVITSDFHLPRTEAAFRWIYGLGPRARDFVIDVEGVADPEMDPQLREDREQKERTSLEALRGVIARIATLQEFHAWLFEEHAAYRAGGGERRELSGKTALSY